MDISFKLDPEVYIGADTLCLIGTIASRYGSRIMVVADNALDAHSINRLKEILEDSRLSVIIFDRVNNNASVDLANNVVELSLAAHCDVIVGIGGQSAQEIARLAAILAHSKTSVFELLDGAIVQDKFLPFISIPTEGANAFSFSKYFIAADPRSRFIKLIQSPNGLQSAVIIDSRLFKFDLNSAAIFVLEGLVSALEAYCSSKANFLSDTFLEKALLIFSKLIRGSASGISIQDGFADNFAQASYLGSFGTFLSSPGIGCALAAAVSSRVPVSRPLCYSALLPVITQRLTNARPEKIARLASLLGAPKTGSVTETAKSAFDVVCRCLEALEVPVNLKEHHISLDRIVPAAEAARNLDFVSNSPWPVSEEDVFNILKEVF